MSMEYVFSIREIGPTPGMMKRELNKLKKVSYQKMGRYWWRRIRPKHFTQAGAREYDYEPREGERGSGHKFRGSYVARKLKKYGHTRPLEFTGETKQSTRRARIVASSKRVRVRMSAPKLNYRPQLRKELVRVSDRDANQLAERFDATLQVQLDKMNNKRGRKRRL